MKSKYVNRAAWMTIILTYIMPYNTRDGFAINYGFPFSYLTIYNHDTTKIPESNLAMEWGVNALGLLLNIMVIYWVMIGIKILERKYKLNRKISYSVLMILIGMIIFKGPNVV